MPFWFWNDDLSNEEIIRQIHDFHSKEIHGFVLHPRLGLPKSIPYLSEKFMGFVETAVTVAAKLGMQVILYDEAMYPSSSANGLVVKKNPEYASRGLRMVEVPCREGQNRILFDDLSQGETLLSIQAINKIGDEIQAEKTVVLIPEEMTAEFTKPDAGDWSIVAFIETFTMGTIRGIHWGQDDGEPDAPRSADLLNPDAVRSFIELTHEKYYERLADHFGKTIIAMFTDEPDLLGRNHLKGLMPWTPGFMEDFIQSGLHETNLPLLWFSGLEGASDSVRKKYHDAVRKRLTATFYKPLSDWCAYHGIALTGHPAESDDIGLLDYFQIPGQDVVWRFIAPEDNLGVKGYHSTLGKCSADAARHRGRRRNLNEVFGVCSKLKGWDLTADEMKWYLDWLFVRGVNLITPHAFYYSIRNERRNERPPDVGPNNIWWSDYALFSRYIKRMSWLMTDSTNQTEVAVLAQEAFLPWKSVQPLFENQIEFNYLEEALLKSNTKLVEGKLHIMNQTYSIVIIEGGSRFDSQTWKTLQTFIEQGGTVLQIEEENSRNQVEIGQIKVSSEQSLPGRINQVLQLKTRLTPASSSLRMSHLVKGNVHYYVLVNEGEMDYKGSFFSEIQGKTEVWYPWTGDIEPAVTYEQGKGNAIEVFVHRREAILIAIDPSQEQAVIPVAKQVRCKTEDLSFGFQLEAIPGNTFRAINQLLPWNQWDGMTYFSGTLTYVKEFVVEHLEDYSKIEIDLGEVYEMARVWINGMEVGVQMWAPYKFSIKEYLITGTNQVKMAVTNSLANRYDHVSLPSGLAGPVSLNYFKQK
ncbi:glycosyl hydrolase [Pullulanibacillus sp. KACC 23026]|nr:glycosylhydrolase-like jelly roll fold domain-containing protein [Pullulanibacillus sp. KACC 23026]WEG14900.1 glycosyl hydrolase [Pullulanibacillus sp. KACC 23026]